MRPLTVQRERFIEQWLATGNATQAYIAAGYEGDEITARTNASRMLANACVQARIEQVRRKATRTKVTTVQTLLEDLEEARQCALVNDQASAAVGATVASAKLLGLMIERTEVGRPGDFEALDTVEAVLQAVQARVGPGAAAMIGQFVGVTIDGVAEREAEKSTVSVEGEAQAIDPFALSVEADTSGRAGSRRDDYVAQRDIESN